MSNEQVENRLKAALNNLDSLPAMPITAQKLLALPLDTDAGEAQMLTLIGQDPQIFAKLIGLANSPAMGVTRKISTVQEASMVLGLSKVKSVAIGIASLSGMGKMRPGKFFDPNALWLHSMTIAMVMRTIAQAMPRKMRPNEDQIFLAGLLHDIGFMALHHLDPIISDELHQLINSHPERSICDLEFELLGVTHGYIGAQLAKHWHLPNEITSVIGFHHPPFVHEIAAENPTALLVSIAERLLNDFGIAENTQAEIPDSDWELLGIDPDEAGEISEQASEIAMQAAQMAGIF